VPGLKARGIRIAICPAGTAESVAELTLFLMIGALRGDARMLHGRSVGLVGLGRIARHVMEVLRPFGVSGLCTARRSRLSAEEEAWLGFRYAPLVQLLAESDVASLHVPATAGTEKLIDAKALARMRPGAVLTTRPRRGRGRGGAGRGAALRPPLGGRTRRVRDGAYAARQPAARHAERVHTPHVGSGASDTVDLKLACCIGNIERFFREGTLAEEVGR
jgi:lactate dehydrogenase-like 2-hydroxyacid dehydrogenase